MPNAAAKRRKKRATAVAAEAPSPAEPPVEQPAAPVTSDAAQPTREEDVSAETTSLRHDDELAIATSDDSKMDEQKRLATPLAAATPLVEVQQHEEATAAVETLKQAEATNAEPQRPIEEPQRSSTLPAVDDDAEWPPLPISATSTTANKQAARRPSTKEPAKLTEINELDDAKTADRADDFAITATRDERQRCRCPGS